MAASPCFIDASGGRGPGGMEVGDEVDAIVSALFECTDVDLHFTEQPAAPDDAGDSPSRRQQTSTARPPIRRSEKSAIGSPRAGTGTKAPAVAEVGREGTAASLDGVARAETTATAAAEDMPRYRGTVFNGESVSLELRLAPKLGELDRTLGFVFGVPEDRDRQLACWSALTSELFVTCHLIQASHSLAAEQIDKDMLDADDRALLIFGPGETRDIQAQLSMPSSSSLGEPQASRASHDSSTGFGGVQWQHPGAPPRAAPPRHTAYPTVALAPKRRAALRRGKSDVIPALYQLDFVVREPVSGGDDEGEDGGDAGGDYCIVITCELGGIQQLRQSISRAVDSDERLWSSPTGAAGRVGSGTVSPAAVPRSPPGSDPAPGTISPQPFYDEGAGCVERFVGFGAGSETAKDAGRAESMRQVLSELDNPLAAQSWPGGNAAFSLLLRVWLQEPLRVEVRSELIASVNYVNVTLASRLSYNITVEELRVHLPTTVPAAAPHAATGAAQQSVLGSTAAAAQSTVCSLTATPAAALLYAQHPHAHREGTGAPLGGPAPLPSGFDAPLRVECHLEPCATHALPVTLCGGEMYGFLYVIRPYDLLVAPPRGPLNGVGRGGGPPRHPGPAPTEAMPHRTATSAVSMASASGGWVRVRDHQDPQSSQMRGPGQTHSRSSSLSSSQYAHQQGVPGHHFGGLADEDGEPRAGRGAQPGWATGQFGDGEAMVSQLAVLYRVAGLPTLFDKVVAVPWRLRTRAAPAAAAHGGAKEEDRALAALCPRLAAPRRRPAPAVSVAAFGPADSCRVDSPSRRAGAAPAGMGMRLPSAASAPSAASRMSSRTEPLAQPGPP